MGSRRLLAVVVAVAMTAATAVTGAVVSAPSAEGAPAWSLVSRLSAGQSPRLATNRSGLMVAAWVVNWTQIRTSFRAPGGSWQPPVTVATSHTGSTPATSLGANLPAIVLDDAGTATVMWAESETDGPGTDIYSASGSMSGWSSPELQQGPVAGPLENYRDVHGPVTAVGRDGTVYATWRLQGCLEYTPPNPRDYYCLTFVAASYFASRPPGGTWTTPERLDADTGAADIAVGPDDTVVIAGTAQAGQADSNRRYATAVTRGPGGSWSSVKVLDTPGHSMAFGWQVHLTADDTDVTAVFGECDARTLCHVAASRGPTFDTTSAISAAVDGARVNVQYDPVRLASSPAGEVTAVWNMDVGREERSEGVIQSRRRPPGTGAWETARTLAPGLQHNQTALADVAVDDNGTAIAGWNSTSYSRATGYTRTAQVALRSAAGTWAAPAEVRANYSVGPVSTRAGTGYTVLAEDGSGIGWSDRIDDTTTPTTRMTSPGTRTTTTLRFPIAWTATDGQSWVARTRVQRRTATWHGTFGRWSTWISRRTARTATYRGRDGRSYCFRARSTDAAGNIGAWSRQQCRTTPVDDRRLRASGGWKRVKVSGAYRGTETRTARHGQRLSLAGSHGRRFALLATTCRTCGSVRVSIRGRVVRTVSLRSRRTIKQHVLPIASYRSLRTRRILLTVRSHGKSVRIDGIAVIH